VNYIVQGSHTFAQPGTYSFTVQVGHAGIVTTAGGTITMSQGGPAPLPPAPATTKAFANTGLQPSGLQSQSLNGLLVINEAAIATFLMANGTDPLTALVYGAVLGQEQFNLLISMAAANGASVNQVVQQVGLLLEIESLILVSS
jgi:hypothetical protein